MEFLADPVAYASSGSFLTKMVLNTLALFAAAYLIKGVKVKSLGRAVIISLVLAFLNATLGPILNTLAIPLKIITLGLFSFVVDAFMVLIVAQFVDGFEVKGFWPALWLAVLMAIFNAFLYQLYI